MKHRHPALILAILPGLAAGTLSLFLFASCAGSPDQHEAAASRLGSWTGSRIAATEYGLVRGRPDSLATISWKGLPYAAPPVGDLRWKAPRPPEPWQGVREASAFGSQPLQRLPVLGWMRGSEDCLYLNVWRPADSRSRLPVYFWIHGGGNSMGSAGSSDYHGQQLAAKAGIVFVSVEYRMGPFGWFAHPGLVTGDAEDDSGNYGTLDLIAALRWVRDNITSFGGDPGNVTIAGESAGAFNVLTLLIAPKARGLFHRAVAESGYRTDSTPEKILDFAAGIARGLDSSAEASAELLRRAPAKKVLSLARQGLAGMLDFPYPNWDGKVLPAEGFAAFSDPSKVADVPLMIGTNKEETKLFQWLGRKNPGDPVYQAGAELASARWKAEGADSIADAILSGDPGRKVYVYRFDWGAPDREGKSVFGGRAGLKVGAAHAMEISFFLQNDSVYANALPLQLFTRANEPGRKDLQGIMGSLLSSFVKTGDPNGAERLPGTRESLPVWESWSAAASEPPFMVFDAGRTEANPRLERGRMTVETTKAALEAYGEPLRSRLEATLKWK
ncbi:MAG: carboxylesterase family protein [Spirochaetes bacterium]|nr:carboxylesterase family protein [Spirochaetota bacterium]